MKISRLQAAEEQLIESINLYFNSNYNVPVYTLIRASHEVLDKLCYHNGKERGVVQQGVVWIKPEKTKEFWYKINEVKNFFKHNDTDPDPETFLEWNPELSQHYIFDAIILYGRLTNLKLSHEMVCFQIWYRINYPEMWNNKVTEFDLLFEQVKHLLVGLEKKEAYRLMLQSAKQISNGDNI